MKRNYWKSGTVPMLVLGLMAPMAGAQQGRDLYPHMSKARGVKAAQRSSLAPMAPGHPRAAARSDSSPQVAAPSKQTGQMQPTANTYVAAAPAPASAVYAAGQAIVQAQSGTPARPSAPSARRDGVSRTEMFFPSGTRDSNSIHIERSVPAEVRAGDMFTYEIKLTNTTGSEVRAVELSERLPSGFNLASTTPAATSEQGSELKWSIGNIGPRQSTLLRVTGSAAATGDLDYCATVTFQTQLCNSNRVVEPALELTMTATPDVILCDPVTLRYVVRNSGSGIARGVKVVAVLPTGWRTQDGRAGITFEAGDLAAGQSKEATIVAKAAETGQFTSTARATEEGGLSAEASADTRVTVPRLVMTKSGPDLRYLGRPGSFEITVRNDGDGPAKDTIVVDDISAGARAVEATEGGQISGGRVSWNLGTLEPGASRSMSVTVMSNQIGVVRNTAFAKAYCGEATAEATMNIEGVPAILLEVIDVHDPIEVGGTETYEIVVTNQGTAPDTGVVIQVTLPPEFDYVSADGPSQGSADGRTVTFAPYPSLAPKQRIVYKVLGRANATGDTRFRAVLTSDVLQSPVEETESTHVY